MATEIWTYGGERILSDGKRGYAWVDPNGHVLYYGKTKGFAVGHCYEMDVTRTEGKTSTSLGKYVGRSLDKALCMELELEHRYAQQELQIKARERNDARQTELDEALAPLIALAAKTNGMHRDALLAYVIRKITKPW